MTSQTMLKNKVFILIVSATVALAPLASAQTKKEDTNQADPNIRITQTPPKGGGPDRMEAIAGTVSGVNSKDCRVVIFALGGDTWYVQPYVASPYTEIKEDGRWENDTHLGSKYGALLVKRAYQPPATARTLPTVGGEILARVVVEAAEQERRDEARTIRFSGYEWKVKSSDGRVGPGPNYFSASDDNVAVDAQGRLHLRITNRAGRWSCAEVISQESFGYGVYRFYVDTNVDQLDPRIVLGLFTWSDEPAYHHREIDVEISRWNDANNKNGQFVVQPYTQPENIVRFPIPTGLSGSTHSFTWEPQRVFCQSVKGLSPHQASQEDVIHQHTFTEHIPRAGGENARINLWLIGGRPPINGQETVVIIRQFEFSPAR